MKQIHNLRTKKWKQKAHAEEDIEDITITAVVVSEVSTQYETQGFFNVFSIH